MPNSNHTLLLGMYSFKIKKRRRTDQDMIKINDFLSESYPDESNKFIDGFAQEIIDLFDEKAFKNQKNTHGGALEKMSFDSGNRYLDVLIDGGLTGIEQFLVNDDGETEKISSDKIIGPKFFARFWMPAGGTTAYVFLQKYNSLNLKPLFDDIIAVTLKKHDCSIALVGNKLHATTTEKRIKNFLKSSYLRDITVISKRSSHDSGAGDAQTVTIKLGNITTKNKNNKVDKSVVEDALKNHGFIIGDREYEMKATYATTKTGIKRKEEKTTLLDASEDSINIIPNIILPPRCVDSNGYPNFEEMKQFVDNEIQQIKIEAKMK